MISGEFWNPSLHSGPSISFGAPEEEHLRRGQSLQRITTWLYNPSEVVAKSESNSELTAMLSLSATNIDFKWKSLPNL